MYASHFTQVLALSTIFDQSSAVEEGENRNWLSWRMLEGFCRWSRVTRRCVANGRRELGAVHVRPKPRGVDGCKSAVKLSSRPVGLFILNRGQSYFDKS
jgi:hypothetical protein